MLLLPSGCGDFTLSQASVLPDPCPLPDKLKKRSLNEREQLIYAPMAGVGGILYDKVRRDMAWFVSSDDTLTMSMCRMLCTLSWQGATPMTRELSPTK